MLTATIKFIFMFMSALTACQIDGRRGAKPVCSLVTTLCLQSLALCTLENVWLFPCSKQIMDPEVPHALRLQAILTSGVVIIHQRQSTYLFEDCNDALVSALLPC